MKAIRLLNYGSSDQLKYEDISIPIINDDQVLVKVYAGSINHLEIKMASGAMKNISPLDLPWIPGYDFAGIIESVGKDVNILKKGDEVYGNCNGGSYAEYLAADISKVAKKPSDMTFIEASSIPHVGETAWQAIHTHGKLKSGQKVLIHGSAGAVGAFAVQFARLTNAFIYATASAEDEEYVKSLGADIVINYKDEDFSSIAKDLDLVIDLVGGETQKRSYPIIKQGGNLVSTVGVASQEEANKYGINVIPMVIKQSGQDLEKITELINNGKIKSDIAMALPLEKAYEGWDILLRKYPSLPKISKGKIVLKIN